MSNTIAHRSGLQMKPALLCAVSLTLLGTTGCGTGRWLGLGGSESSNNAKPTGNNTPSPQLTNKEFAEFAMENANSLRQQGFYQDALRELQRAIALNPELPAAYAQAGDIYRDLGEYQQAEKSYREGVRKNPRDFDNNFGLGLTLHLMNRLSEAVRTYLVALTIRPDDFETNKNLGITYLQLNEPRQGLPYAVRAVELNPTSGPARVNLGAIYAALGDDRNAVVEYQQAAELMELSPELLLNLAESLRKLGREEEVFNTLKQLVAVSPSAVAHERLGAALFRNAEYQASYDQFQRALEFDPDHYPALNGLGVYKLNVYLWSDKRDRSAMNEAITAFRRSLQINPSQPRIIELITRYN
ncbi:MAG: tetratricopeptide repeat protein [Phycisphaeraceae bacterium]|nr:tetratricopeptide repeat protein [Phycisphaerales bacterium]MCB9861374.1 tetratricopeptide repeat protein [Phycisphaeraceae bacterium]